MKEISLQIITLITNSHPNQSQSTKINPKLKITQILITYSLIVTFQVVTCVQLNAIPQSITHQFYRFNLWVKPMWVIQEISVGSTSLLQDFRKLNIPIFRSNGLMLICIENFIGKKNIGPMCWFENFLSKRRLIGVQYSQKIQMQILQDETIYAQFQINISPDLTRLELVSNIPYTLQNLEHLHQRLQQSLFRRGKAVYYHREVSIYSPDQFPVYLCTITSANNILNYGEHEQHIWPNKEIRPHKLKNRPEIVIVGRVHPSEVVSSWFVDSIIENLVNNTQFTILLQFFIFRIFPMINPDGVENGNYRLDSYLQNLNRFYGHSHTEKSPSIYVVQKLLEKLREQEKIFMFLDVHGHTSPKPSFIYGNYSTNLFQCMENRAFCKILEIMNEDGAFEYVSCQFSKRNMTVKQKYDQHSKQASGRVFAYRGNSQQDNLQTNLRNFYFVQHSYTYEVMPYILSNTRKNIRKNFRQALNSNSYRNLNIKAAIQLSKSEYIPTSQLSIEQIRMSYQNQGTNFLLSLCEMIGINEKHEQIKNIEEMLIYRKVVYRQLMKNPEYFMSDRNKRIITKEIDQHFLRQYCTKWGFLQIYEQCQKYDNIAQQLQKCQISEILKNQLKTLRIEKTEKTIQKSNIRNSHKSEKRENASRIIVNEQKRISDCQSLKNDLRTFSKPLSHLEFTKNVQRVRQIQFPQMLTKSQKKIHEKSPNKYRIQNEKSRSPIKKKIAHYTETDQMEDKIRKMIFRHKTQNEIQIYSQEAELAPLQNTKEAKSHPRSQIGKKYVYSQDFDDNKMIGKNLARFQKNSENPLISQMEEVLRRISIKNGMIMQTIDSNDLINAQNTHNGLKHSQLSNYKNKINKNRDFNNNELESQKKTFDYNQHNGKQICFVGIQSNTLLPPVSTPSIPIPYINNDKQFTYRSKLHGLKKVKSKKKIEGIFSKKKQEKINEVMVNFKTMETNSSNQKQLLTKAKKIIQDRKNIVIDASNKHNKKI